MGGFEAWLGAPPPELDSDGAERLARSLYGLTATAKPLYAERDRNFRLDIAAGERAILKISNADADPAQVGFQVCALRHINRADPEFPAPRLMPTTDGAHVGNWDDADGCPHLVRLLSWLEGECIAVHEAPQASRRDAGRALARLGRALRDCSAAGAPRDLPWDLGNTANLRPLLSVLADDGLRELARDKLDRFEAEIAPQLATLPRQLIHNDLNPDNLLFSAAPNRRVSGIIDFGDMVEAPLVCDLAVAAAYHLADGDDPLGELLPVIRGYEEIAPLDETSRRLLLPLVECRLLATLLIQGSRSGDGESFTLDQLRPSSREAALRLRHLSLRPEAWSTERLLKLLA
jgi:Ser/Thr protein kinase RdoA (MazF antagonist)